MCLAIATTFSLNFLFCSQPLSTSTTYRGGVIKKASVAPFARKVVYPIFVILKSFWRRRVNIMRL